MLTLRNVNKEYRRNQACIHRSGAQRDAKSKHRWSLGHRATSSWGDEETEKKNLSKQSSEREKRHKAQREALAKTAGEKKEQIQGIRGGT